MIFFDTSTIKEFIEIAKATKSKKPLLIVVERETEKMLGKGFTLTDIYRKLQEEVKNAGVEIFAYSFYSEYMRNKKSKRVLAEKNSDDNDSEAIDTTSRKAHSIPLTLDEMLKK